MSATLTMNPSTQVPHRKPVPTQRSYNDLQQPMQQSQLQSQQLSAGNSSQPRQSLTSQPTGTSPNIPERVSPVLGSQAPPPSQQAQYGQQNRRTLSNATSSTSSTNNGLQRVPTNSAMPRRSTSSRSNSSASPTSYVALMRKQKGTVWCDRAQLEDPNVLAKKRHLKMTAAREVAGGSRINGSRISTSSSNLAASGGIRSKIRHQGAPKANQYLGGANMSGAYVPVRLSATEFHEDDSGDEGGVQRNGSGRSSMGSERKGSNQGAASPSGYSPTGSMGDLAEEETPVPTNETMGRSNYFDQSGSDGVEEHPPVRSATARERKLQEDLQRRGSVDDRTMTMSAVRLFVANPDSDSSD